MRTFTRFLIAGFGGAGLNLLVTFLATHFIFGVSNYFFGYLLGIAANLIFNFALYTVSVFKTRHDHGRRLFWFVLYGLVMAFFQSSIVRVLVSSYGAQWYLLIIAGTIGVLAVLNFFVFRQNIFDEHREREAGDYRASLALICLMAILVRLGVLFHALSSVGLSALIYGDALGYRTLAASLWQGNGFSTINAMGSVVPELFRTPGLPLLLAPFAGTDTGMAAYLALLALISGALLPFLTFRVTERVASARAGLIAAGIVAFEPQLVFFSVLPQTELPFILFAYGALLLSFAAYQQRSWVLAVIAGIGFGFASLIRPGFWPVYVVCLLATLVCFALKKRSQVRILAFMLLASIITLSPWFVRMKHETGMYSLSGAGWRNVYTDYLASVRATDKHTEFSIEKHALKQESYRAGVPTSEIDNPASAGKLRDFALAELWQKKVTVLKIEPVLLVSYFIQDGYYYQFLRFGFLPPDNGGHISATFTLLSKGIHGIPLVLGELARQAFLPILGRFFTISVVIFSGIGLFFVRSRLKYLFALCIVLSAVTSTVIGFGVEARLRLPMEPLLFAFTAAGLLWAIQKIRTLYAH